MFGQSIIKKACVAMLIDWEGTRDFFNLHSPTIEEYSFSPMDIQAVYPPVVLI